MAWIYLAIAIVTEVIGTIAIKASDGFTNSTAGTVCLIAYCIAFYFLSLVVKTIPVGIAYAVWAGVGIVLVSAISVVWFKQVPDLPAIIGITFIVVGVVVINVFSTSVNH